MPCGFSTVLNRKRYSGAMGEKGGTNEHRSKHHHMLFQTFQLFRRFISRGVPVYVRENLGFWHHVSWGFKGPTIKFLGQLLACPMGACDWACNIDASCGGTNPFLSHQPTEDPRFFRDYEGKSPKNQCQNTWRYHHGCLWSGKTARPQDVVGCCHLESNQPPLMIEVEHFPFLTRNLKKFQDLIPQAKCL